MKFVVNNQFKKILFIFLSLLLFSFHAPMASADTGYRYWGYFQAPAGATTWTAAMTGPSTKLKDGDVEGWTFTASSNDIPATAPMMDPDFATLCQGVSEVSGKIRVGLVVDFGGGEIAPEGETPREFFSDCIVISPESTGMDVLSSALDVRTDKSGLICGIAGYPARECGVEIQMPQAVTVAATKNNSLSESGLDPNSVALGALAIAALIVAFVALRRRSK